MEENTFYITEDVLASKNMRFVNNLIDLIPQYAIMYAISYSFFYIGEFTGNYALNDYWAEISTVEDYFYSYLLLFLYYFIMESTTHRTLGKYATKTMVVMTNGQKPTHKDIAKRSLSRMIPFDALSFLGTNGKGWHDVISNTYVVDIAKFEAIKKSYDELEQIGAHLIKDK
ncbi:RDD family protein [Hyunsoonleella sp. 2307UL5-6]|uniref:RDD family protein n=1 Tax=Hyunsoonleella sp. 2307UL5-6 TaxID=3384768 RepID=UPI0039BC6BE7